MSIDKDNFDFNKALKEIQDINVWFQNEDISLDEGLSKLKRGLELIKKCNARITDVENQFNEIKQTHNIKEESESLPTTEVEQPTITVDELPF